MPTYEYKCTKCGHTFEAFQSISEKPISRCPECKGTVRRLINGGLGVIFKGSGFYSTDNKKGSALTGGNGGSSKDKEKKTEGSASSEKLAAAEKSSSDTSAKKTPEKTAAS
jgi:putative FmdB family regulatory protein